MKPSSNVVLLFKSSGINMEDDQKAGRGFEILVDRRCVLLPLKPRFAHEVHMFQVLCPGFNQFVVVVQCSYIAIYYKVSACLIAICFRLVNICLINRTVTQEGWSLL